MTTPPADLISYTEIRTQEPQEVVFSWLQGPSWTSRVWNSVLDEIRPVEVLVSLKSHLKILMTFQILCETFLTIVLFCCSCEAICKVDFVECYIKSITGIIIE